LWYNIESWKVHKVFKVCKVLYNFINFTNFQTKDMWVLVIQRMLLEFVLDILYFPIWWYTGGAKKALVWCYYQWQDANIQMAPGLWLKNIFVPMFGQHDWQGRLMSFFIRFCNVIVRSIFLLIWTGILAVVFVLWMIFPLCVLYMLSRAFN